MFYSMVASLDREAHASLRLDTKGGFAFAKGSNSLSLSLSELGAASVHYPIVFTAGDGLPMPMAIVGYRDSENLLVEADGSWSPGAYIPCCLRVYPFIFIEAVPGSDNLSLGVEARSPLLSEAKGEALFDSGKPTSLLEEKLSLADSFRRDIDATRAFGEALAAADVLVPEQATLDFISGGTHRLVGFRGIDPARFGALPEPVVLDWWQKGYLEACYAVLHSQFRWGGLLRMAEQLEQQRSAPA
jgi:hypothetical protein